MRTIWYSSESEGERYSLGIDSLTCLQRPSEARQVVQNCAADFHDRHDGWECTWPRTFTLYDTEDGPVVAAFNVERESVPVFVVYIALEPTVRPHGRGERDAQERHAMLCEAQKREGEYQYNAACDDCADAIRLGRTEP